MGFASEIDPDVGFALCEAGTTKMSTPKTATSNVLNIASRVFEVNEADLRVGKVRYMVALLKLETTVFIEVTGSARRTMRREIRRAVVIRNSSASTRTLYSRLLRNS
jgi:hypothetical protein